jgi:hypothetical protein
MKKFVATFLWGIGLAACACSARAADLSQRLKKLGSFGDWEAYSYNQPDGKVCYTVSYPKKSEGKYTRRDDVFIMVTRWPNMANDTTHFQAGYIYKTKWKPTIRVDSEKEITMFSTEGNAWMNNTEEDAQVIKEFQAGNQAVVVGVSSRGTKTTDTFSLKGFSKAYQAISNACPRKASKKK